MVLVNHLLSRFDPPSNFFCWSPLTHVLLFSGWVFVTALEEFPKPLYTLSTWNKRSHICWQTLPVQGATIDPDINLRNPASTTGATHWSTGMPKTACPLQTRQGIILDEHHSINSWRLESPTIIRRGWLELLIGSYMPIMKQDWSSWISARQTIPACFPLENSTSKTTKTCQCCWLLTFIERLPLSITWPSLRSR